MEEENNDRDDIDSDMLLSTLTNEIQSKQDQVSVLLGNSGLCRNDSLIGKSQNKDSWLIISTSILDKEV